MTKIKDFVKLITVVALFAGIFSNLKTIEGFAAEMNLKILPGDSVPDEQVATDEKPVDNREDNSAIISSL